MSSLMLKVNNLKENINNLKTEENIDNIKILDQMSNILHDIVEKIDSLEHNVSDINEYVSVLDENLGNVEEEVYGFEEDEDEFDSYEYIDIICTGCNEVIAIEKSILSNEEKMLCPNCRKSIDLKQYNK